MKREKVDRETFRNLLRFDDDLYPFHAMQKAILQINRNFAIPRIKCNFLHQGWNLALILLFQCMCVSTQLGWQAQWCLYHIRDPVQLSNGAVVKELGWSLVNFTSYGSIIMDMPSIFHHENLGLFILTTIALPLFNKSPKLWEYI